MVARAEMRTAEQYAAAAHRRLTAAIVGRASVDRIEAAAAMVDLEVALGGLYRARVALESATGVQGDARR